MSEILSFLLNFSVLTFAVSSMLSVGFGYSAREILGPLRNIRGVILTLLANFVLVPILAVLILRIIPLDIYYKIGLFLVATAAGAPFVIKLAQHANSNLAITTTMLVILLPVTVVYMPIVIPLALPGVEVNPWAIAMPLALTMLLPLTAGLLIRAWARTWAERLRPYMGKIASIAIVVLLAATILQNLRGILNLFSTDIEAIPVAVFLVVGAFLIGWIVGIPLGENRDELALATSQRNIAAATVVATQTFSNPKTIIIVVVTSIIGLGILFPVAALLRKRESQRAARTGIQHKPRTTF